MIESAGLIWDALQRAGLLPAGHALPRYEDPGNQLLDLMPLVIGAWSQAANTALHPEERRRAERRLEKFQAASAMGARLTVDFPDSNSKAAGCWLGHRLAWWPRGIPPGRRIGLASSRLGSAPDLHELWFVVLRAACEKIDREHDLLLSATSTATARYVERCAALFGLRVLRIEVPDDDAMALDKWFDWIQSRQDYDTQLPHQVVFLSPPIQSMDGCVPGPIRDVPVRDRAIVALSDQLFIFRVRPNGNLDRLVRARLSDPMWPVASLYVAIGPTLVQTEMADAYMHLGAIGWIVLLASGSEKRTAKTVCQISCPRNRAPFVPVPVAEPWDYLTHCTCRRKGPWPGQVDTDYLDDLILDRDDADHSAIAALRRIVCQKRLIASSQMIRGGTPVVSFTAVPLACLYPMRVFRPHRGRWDFEPYGICIRRSNLEKLGARPVLYGDNQQWASLPATERPFFQYLDPTRAKPATQKGLQTSTHHARMLQTKTLKHPTGRKPVDWSMEDEWRILGDLDLAQIPPDSILVFVPTVAAAQTIAAVSDWPVVVLSKERERSISGRGTGGRE